MARTEKATLHTLEVELEKNALTHLKDIDQGRPGQDMTRFIVMIHQTGR